MFLRNLLGVLGITLAVGISALAQEQTPAKPDDAARRERHELRQQRHRERMGRHKEMRMRGAGLRGLNLSDAQREQVRAIMERRLESIKTQREELSKMREKRIAGTFDAADEARAKALREEIRARMEGVKAETEAVLTAEQKLQLAQRKAERNARHEERKANRELRKKELRERLNKNPQ